MTSDERIADLLRSAESGLAPTQPERARARARLRAELELSGERPETAVPIVVGDEVASTARRRDFWRVAVAAAVVMAGVLGVGAVLRSDGNGDGSVAADSDVEVPDTAGGVERPTLVAGERVAAGRLAIALGSVPVDFDLPEEREVVNVSERHLVLAGESPTDGAPAVLAIAVSDDLDAESLLEWLVAENLSFTANTLIVDGSPAADYEIRVDGADCDTAGTPFAISYAVRVSLN